MVAAIKQVVTVGAGGRIEISAPELRAGSRAEVIILVPQEPCATPDGALAALDQLQQSVKLDRRSADAWIREVSDERRAI